MEKAEWEKLIDGLVKQGILHSPKIVKVMRNLPRSKFLPADKQLYGSKDTPLPIGFGQITSAPQMVAIMNEALRLEVGHKVLEVGAGSGWHAATMAELVATMDMPRSEWGHVYTVEIIQALAEAARKSIMNTGYGDRVTIINADGSKGYPEKAPYDRIVVKAAVTEIPQPLLDQLKAKGVMVIPVGNLSLFQTLVRLTKNEDGQTRQESLGEVSFVPLTGE
ncbi:MAG: protein-L-isoaspartate(D-aspartate) O-methyltransferase [Candidatus Bathyarchaeia archaeon]